MLKTFARNWQRLVDRGYSKGAALVYGIIGTTLGLAIRFGIYFLIALGARFVYNTVACEFNWPEFSVWVWFVAVVVIEALLGWGRTKKEG